MSDPATLAALVAGAREHEGVAIDVPERTAPYSYQEVCTNSWKAANLLDYYGAHPGGRVGLAVGPKPVDADTSDREGVLDSAEPLLAMLGGALLEARVLVLETPGTVETDAFVRPAGAGWSDRYPAQPGVSTLAYGGPPEAADVHHFETQLWSQNPSPPPERPDPETPALEAGGSPGTAYGHGTLVRTARAVAERESFEPGLRVELAADVREPGALVAGVLAPLSAGATVVLAGGEADRRVTDEGGDGTLDAGALTGRLETVSDS